MYGLDGTVGYVLNPYLPSESALTAAAARAAHLLVDAAPPIFEDSLAAPLLGDRADELLDYHRNHGAHPILAAARAQVVLRSRYAEDRVADGLTRDIRQYVLLGAGLDSFGYRSPLAREVVTFEVDHPASQDGKRARLSAAGIPVPEAVRLVPVDFERDALVDRLVAAGFDPGRPAVVAWLGVSMYLTGGAIDATLAALGGLPAGTELVLDYMVPAGLRDAAGQSFVDGVGPVTAARGEPWLSFFTPDEMAERLDRYGLESLAQVTQREAVPPEVWDRDDALKPSTLSRIGHARVRPTAG